MRQSPRHGRHPAPDTFDHHAPADDSVVLDHFDDRAAVDRPLDRPTRGQPDPARRPGGRGEDRQLAARPQSGVDEADVVYEELVEGGLTRLAAVFQSQDPTVVGPYAPAD